MLSVTAVFAGCEAEPVSSQGSNVTQGGNVVQAGDTCDSDDACMQLAIDMSAQGANTKYAGPIGAVLVKDGVVIGAAYSQVGTTGDPSAHAEVVAIREAAEHTHSHDMKGATLYTSVAPCPMCRAVSYWANVGKTYYGISSDESLGYGFPDRAMFTDFAQPESEQVMPLGPLPQTDAADSAAAEEVNQAARTVLDDYFADAENWDLFDGFHRWSHVPGLYEASGYTPETIPMPPKPDGTAAPDQGDYHHHDVQAGTRCETKAECMQLAVQLSDDGAHTKYAGPIGAVVVKDGMVIGAAFSQVGTTRDPTAHAEVVAIRRAAEWQASHDVRGSHDMRGAELYTSVAPCAMCRATSYWANIGVTYYAISSDEALDYGFPDKVMYEDFARPDDEEVMALAPLPNKNEATKTVLDEYFSDATNWKLFDGFHRWGHVPGLYEHAGLEPDMPPKPPEEGSE